MKNIKKILYFFIVLGVLSAILYKEKEFLDELMILKAEQLKKREVIIQSINENYYPRKKDFYKNTK